MLTENPCSYHGRNDCQACKALHLALLAEKKGSTTLMEKQITKAVELEAAGQ